MWIVPDSYALPLSPSLFHRSKAPQLKNVNSEQTSELFSKANHEFFKIKKPLSLIL
jgi:hypothetical protein